MSVPEQEKMGAGGGAGPAPTAQPPPAGDAQPSFTYKTTPVSGDSNKGASRDPKCTYVASCRCGAVELELTGQPVMVTCCYCTDCQANGRYLEKKAKEENLPDPLPYSYAGEGGGTRGGGMYAAAFWLENIKVVKGATALKGYRMSEKSTNVRTCCRHCRTSVLGAGGKKFPANFRPVNANCIKYVHSGERYQPVPQYRFGGKHAQTEAWKAAPTPKYNVLPMSLVCGKMLPAVLCPCVFPGKGEAAKTPDVPGFLDDPAKHSEIVDASAYHDLGFRAPGEHTDPKKKVERGPSEKWHKERPDRPATDILKEPSDEDAEK